MSLSEFRKARQQNNNSTSPLSNFRDARDAQLVKATTSDGSASLFDLAQKKIDSKYSGNSIPDSKASGQRYMRPANIIAPADSSNAKKVIPTAVKPTIAAGRYARAAREMDKQAQREYQKRKSNEDILEGVDNPLYYDQLNIKKGLIGDLTENERQYYDYLQMNNNITVANDWAKQALDGRTRDFKVLGRDENGQLSSDVVNALKKGYLESVRGQQIYAKNFLGDETANPEKYDEILSGREYQYAPGNIVEKAIEGAAGLMGQQARQITDPRTLAIATGMAAEAAAASAIAPGAGIFAVPGAFTLGMATGNAASNMEIEAGNAYEEMIENGVSETTARKVAAAVGVGNALIENLELSEVMDAFQALSKSALTRPLAEQIRQELLDRGMDILSETAQEVAQEGVTIAGTQYATKKDTGKDAYTSKEVMERLRDTALSSALSFGVMNIVPGGRHTIQILGNRSEIEVANEIKGRLVDKGVDEETADAIAPKVSEALHGKAIDKQTETILSNNQSVRSAITEMVEDTYNKKRTKEEVTADLADSLGKNGKKVFESIVKDAKDGTEATKKFRAVANIYNATVFGREADVESARSVLTGDQISEVLKAGAMDADMRYDKASYKELSKNLKNFKGEVKAGTSNLNTLNLNAFDSTRRAEMTTVDAFLSKALGINVEWFESVADSKGEYQGENGSYENSTNTIRLDVNAGAMSVNDTTKYTVVASHELTHWLENKAPKVYAELTDAVLNTLANDLSYSKGADISHIIQAEMNRLEAAGLNSTRENAIHELVARSCENMLSQSSKTMQMFNSLSQESKNTIWGHVQKVFKNLKAFFKNMLSQYKSTSNEARTIANNLEELDRIEKLWSKALEQSLKTQEYTKAKALEDAGIAADKESAYSYRTWLASDNVINAEATAQALAKTTGVSYEKAVQYLKDVTSVAKIIQKDANRLGYLESGLSPFVSNVEYGGSIDFDTLCPKRRTFIGTFQAIQKQLPNTALTPAEFLEIRDRLDKAGFEVFCGKCYVEGSRASMGVFADEFRKLYKKYNPKAWQPTMVEVNTPDGVEWMRINHPECYEKYEYFWNHYGTLKPGDPNLFASQQKPKLFQAHSAYTDELMKEFKNAKNIAEKNRNGGIRFQSFSDCEVVHIIDGMQVITDMAKLGLAGQGYTKQKEFVLAFGNTGLKINLSIDAWGVDKNGKLLFNDKEGMPYKTAMKLRNMYPQNVGTICCVYDDKMLMAALADPTIDFIIPFHRSQWNKAQYKAMGLPSTTKDYTDQQNEKWIDQSKHTHEYRGRQVNDKCTNFMPNEYWDFSKSGKENAQKYLQMCAEAGKRPKFYKLLTDNKNGTWSLKEDGRTDGYWKLLIDFKMYDNDGVGSPQMPVIPEFNMKEIRKMLKSYEEGATNYPVAHGIVDDFVKEKKAELKKKGVKQYSDRDYAKAVESNDMSTAQTMVDEAARKAGYTIKVYHGTANGGRFNIFDPSKLNNTKLSSHIGQGFYFTESKEGAREYTSVMDVYGNTRPGTNPYLYEGYLKLQNPIEITENSHKLSFNTIRDIIASGDNEWFFDRGIAQDIQNKEINGRSYSKDELLNMSKGERIDLLARWLTSYGDMTALNHMVDAYRYGNQGGLLDAMKQYIGSDGIVWKMKDGLHQYVAFDSSQFKESAPVEYDDSGKLIPLSERFNPARKDIRYSDREYMNAVNSNDIETAQRMVDEAARKAGYTYKAFHHTENRFTRFDIDKARRNMDIQGFYFSADPNAESEYGSMRYDTYLKMNNPYIVDSVEKMNAIPFDMSQGDAGVIAREWLQENGYDGVIRKADFFGAEADEYIVFDSSQIKSSDYVTFDDNEEVVPLSERFNNRDDDIRFMLRDGAEDDINRALEDKEYREEVHLTDTTPPIMAGRKGVKNLPMMMKPSHIRENIFTEEEAKEKGLPTGKDIHYHGLGKTLFMQIIDGLRYVTLAYRGTKNAKDSTRRENYFLLVSHYTAKDGSIINVPVYINETVQKNKKFIEINKIATVFGRENFDKYIRNEIKNHNLVRIKNRSIQSSERLALIANGYAADTSTDRVTQLNKNSQAENTKQFSDRNYAPTFYSQLQRQIENYKGDKIGAASVESYLKGKGVKDEEIKWSGIRTFLEGKKSVGKQELLDYLKANQLIIEQDTRSEYTNFTINGKPGTLEQYANSALEEMGYASWSVYRDDDEGFQELDFFDEDGNLVDSELISDAPRWGEYKLDGGTNYREYLYKMPGSDYFNDAMKVHWGEPGVLAHARVQDFMTPNGEKVLFVEEIQSDWHNAGQKEGYKSEGLKSDASKMKITQSGYNSNVDMPIWTLKDENGLYLGSITRETEEEAREAFEPYFKEELERATSILAPDAPFSKNYTDFVLKSLLREAAENGYDYLAWTTAEMQSDRWSSDYAKGYRIEYDQDIPKFLNKYGKQWGAKVTEIPMDSSQRMNDGEFAGVWEHYYSAPAIPITDSMVDSVLYEGQSQFSERGNVSIDEQIQEFIKQYGAFPRGENAVRDVRVPTKTSEDKNVSRYVRTVLESGITNEEMDEQFKKAIIDEALSYEPVTDKQAEDYANRIIDTYGVEEAQKRWDAIHNGTEAPSKDDMVLAQKLLIKYAESGDAAATLKLTQELAAEGTRAGQEIQAMRMLKKMAMKNPAVGLGYIQSTVDKMNHDFEKRTNGEAKRMVVDPALAEAYLNAQTEEERDAAVGAIYQNLADQMPKGKWEKWEDRLRAWRYLAMLGNPRTHIRNLVGNAIFVPVVSLKNAIGTALEATTKGEKTKAIKLAEGTKEFAANDVQKVMDILQGNETGSVKQEIDKRVKPFSTKALNAVSDFNSNLLEKEDMIFLRFHYINAMAQYLTANKIDPSQITDKQLKKARQYAISEAKKATYRDASKFATWLNKSGKTNRLVRYIVEGTVPFKKTPTNILKRGIEYSPIGLIKTISKGVYDLNKNKISTNEFIDQLSSGLSGTLIMGLGMMLASMGVVSGGYEDDDKDLKKLLGEQEYSVRIGDYTYTIDWAAPAALPFFIGAEIIAALRGDREGQLTFNDIANAAMNIIDPMQNLSMLSGLNNTLSAITYEEKKLPAAVMETFYNLLGQFIPTLFGQVARTIDTTQRANYIDKNKGIPQGLYYFINKMVNKIPFMTFLHDPYLNQFGEENVSPRWQAFLENFISPGYLEKGRDDSVTTEIARLQGETEENVVPQKMPKYLGTGEDRVDLTSEQYTLFQRVAGQAAYNILDNMIVDPRYQNLSSEQQAEAIKAVYKYAKYVGRKAVQPDYELSTDKWMTDLDGQQAFDHILTKIAASEYSDSVKEEDLKKMEETGMSAQEFYDRRDTKKSIDDGLEDAGIKENKYSYIVSHYTPDEAVKWYEGDNSRLETKNYKAWVSKNYTTWDYIKTRSDLEKVIGSKKDEEKEKAVMNYILKSVSSEPKRKLVFQMAGYDLNSTKDGKEITDGNYNKKMEKYR